MQLKLHRLLILVLSGALPACGAVESAPVAPQWRIEPTAAFRARQQQFLDYCATENGAGRGGRHGHACLVATGRGEFDRDVLAEQFEKIRARRDTSDFDLTSLLRMLYLDRETGALPDDLRAGIEDVVLGFKYWLDEPGPDTMVWWSENHQILFHSLEYLAGHLFPDRVFTNSGMTGRQHVEHARPMLLRWLYERARFGFSEFHSNVYFNEDMPPLLNLVDFAPDEDIRAKAAIILDIIAIDIASNAFQGYLATAHGRTYPDKVIDGLGDSTREAAWIMLGTVPVTDIHELSPGNFTAAMLATSSHYNPPPLIEAYAATVRDRFEHRQRDSILISEGPDWGIGYETWDDIMFWWGMTGYVAPEVISGTFLMVDNFNMWDGATFSDLKILKPLVGTSVLETAAAAFAPLSRGVALERASTYVYRTPYYQLAGVQDYKPSQWAAQVHPWKATLTPRAYVFTTWPGGSSGDYAFTDWTGGFLPRATLDRAVGIIQYRRPELNPVADEILRVAEQAGFGGSFEDQTHAWFPRTEFDEVVTAAGWTFGRAGDAWLGLWSQRPVSWAADSDAELVAEGRDNVWIIQLGSIEEQESFAAFVEAVRDAAVQVTDGKVVYESPWQGRYETAWTGPLLRDGAEVEPWPYPRWKNDYLQQAFGERTTVLRLGEDTLTLDFDAASRRQATGDPLSDPADAVAEGGAKKQPQRCFQRHGRTAECRSFIP